jgi:hypothetical protein
VDPQAWLEVEPLVGAASRYHSRHASPKDDSAALERERDELPALITTYEHELLATPVEEMEKRKQLRWQLRLAEKRLAEINARLA